MIQYSEKIESTNLLGPGKRAVLWVFGCCFDCPGCIAYNFKHGTYIEDTAENLAQWFLETKNDDITISGGEPMLQAVALSEMIEIIRKSRNVGVIVYSGFTYEELKRKADGDSGVKKFLSQIDILIDGPYRKELNFNEPYRGSSNQRILPLTGRYAGAMDEYYRKSGGRDVEILIRGDKTLMIGVPSKDQAAIWQKIKKSDKF